MHIVRILKEANKTPTIEGSTEWKDHVNISEEETQPVAIQLLAGHYPSLFSLVQFRYIGIHYNRKSLYIGNVIFLSFVLRYRNAMNLFLYCYKFATHFHSSRRTMMKSISKTTVESRKKDTLGNEFIIRYIGFYFVSGFRYIWTEKSGLLSSFYCTGGSFV